MLLKPWSHNFSIYKCIRTNVWAYCFHTTSSSDNSLKQEAKRAPIHKVVNFVIYEISFCSYSSISQTCGGQMAWESNPFTMSRLVWMSKDLVSLIRGATILDFVRLRVQLMSLLVEGKNFFKKKSSGQYLSSWKQACACVICRIFKVNGEPIFIRGGNWILSDGLLRLTKKRYMTDIKFHADMNFNMLRCWGGGLAERPDFYHFCDVYGLMVSFYFLNWIFWCIIKIMRHYIIMKNAISPKKSKNVIFCLLLKFLKQSFLLEVTCSGCWIL